MRLTTGWYNKNGIDEYIVVKPLKNGHRQSLVIGAYRWFGHWEIMLGVFSSNVTYDSMQRSAAWDEPTSTNLNPSFKTATLALEGLKEIEEEIRRSRGEGEFIYIGAMDSRRMHAYTRVLTKKCGYEISEEVDEDCGLPMLCKRV